MNRLKDILLDALIFTAFVAMLFLFFGCGHTKVVTMPEIHRNDNDSIRTEYKHDSIYIDRVHNVFVKGDTVRIHDSIYIEKWRDRFIHDSIVKVKSDSIPYPVEVEIPVAYKSVYTKFTSWFFWIMLAIGIGCGLWKLADYVPVLNKWKLAIKLFLHIA